MNTTTTKPKRGLRKIKSTCTSYGGWLDQAEWRKPTLTRLKVEKTPGQSLALTTSMHLIWRQIESSGAIHRVSFTPSRPAFNILLSGMKWVGVLSPQSREVGAVAVPPRFGMLHRFDRRERGSGGVSAGGGFRSRLFPAQA